MRILPIVPVLTVLILAGCGGGSSTLDAALDQAQETLPETANPTQEVGEASSDSLLTQFSGAAFVALRADQEDPESVAGVGSVSFTNDTVTWTQSEIVLSNSLVLSQSIIIENGSFENDFSDELLADFPDRDIAFQSDSGNLIWDSLSYRRANGSQFTSQAELVEFLNDSLFVSNEQFDIAGGQSEGQALSNYTIRFEGDQAFWAERGGIVLIGTVNFVDDSSFSISFVNREITVVALNRDELVIDAVVYEKDLSNQFDSQQTLVAFLDGASFMSTSLQIIGETSPGVSALGHWFIDFAGDTFTWSYSGIAEAGTIAFIETNRFSATLSDRVLLIDAEGDEFVWDGVRYRKVIGE